MPLVVEVRRVRSPNEPDLSSRRVEILPGLRVRDRGFIVAHLSVLVTSARTVVSPTAQAADSRVIRTLLKAAGLPRTFMRPLTARCTCRRPCTSATGGVTLTGMFIRELLVDLIPSHRIIRPCGVISRSAWAAASAAQDFSANTAPSISLSGRLLQRRCDCSSEDAYSSISWLVAFSFFVVNSAECDR